MSNLAQRASVARGFTLAASRPTRLVDSRAGTHPAVSHVSLVAPKTLCLNRFSGCPNLFYPKSSKGMNKPGTMYEDIKPNTLEFFNSRSRVKHLDAEEKIVFLFDYSTVPVKPSHDGTNGPLLYTGQEVIDWRVLRDL
ncbi:hypothetical protein OESDEN_25428, partial [Oesophagostomum dentatum]